MFICSYSLNNQAGLPKLKERPFVLGTPHSTVGLLFGGLRKAMAHLNTACTSNDSAPSAVPSVATLLPLLRAPEVLPILPCPLLRVNTAGH